MCFISQTISCHYDKLKINQLFDTLWSSFSSPLVLFFRFRLFFFWIACRVENGTFNKFIIRLIWRRRSECCFHTNRGNTYFSSKKQEKYGTMSRKSRKYVSLDNVPFVWSIFYDSHFSYFAMKEFFCLCKVDVENCIRITSNLLYFKPQKLTSNNATKNRKRRRRRRKKRDNKI